MAYAPDDLARLHAGIGQAKNSAHEAGSFDAAYIPAKPAGPGGDQPNPNPFPTKDGGFGKRV